MHVCSFLGLWLNITFQERNGDPNNWHFECLTVTLTPCSQLKLPINCKNSPTFSVVKTSIQQVEYVQ